jgi:proline iminopeptidase
MVLRGVCAMRPREIDWMYRGGAAMLRPSAWARFLAPVLPEGAPSAWEDGLMAGDGSGGGGGAFDPLLAYYERLLSIDPAVRDAAVSWQKASPWP